MSRQTSFRLLTDCSGQNFFRSISFERVGPSSRHLIHFLSFAAFSNSLPKKATFHFGFANRHFRLTLLIMKEASFCISFPAISLKPLDECVDRLFFCLIVSSLSLIAHLFWYFESQLSFTRLVQLVKGTLPLF
jgi:hypothetical protein